MLSALGGRSCTFRRLRRAIDAATPDGQATGVVQDSVVSCLLMATIKAGLVDKLIGVLSDQQKQKLNACLMAALDLP